MTDSTQKGHKQKNLVICERRGELESSTATIMSYHLTPEQRERIIAAIKEGLRSWQLRERFGLSYNTVTRMKKEAKKT